MSPHHPWSNNLCARMKDVAFSSPSAAVGVMQGRANAKRRTMWKTGAGYAVWLDAQA